MSARRRGALSIPTAALAVLVFVVCLVFGVSSVARAEGETGAATEAAAAARAGESDESSLEADDSEATAFEVTTPEGIKVSASVPEGALPEGAELHAELVESEKDNQAVADELEKAEVSYDGFLALDVFFTDTDGNEVEPAEPVDVRFELPEGTLPEGAEDLAVHHLAEAEDGTVAEIEAVADDADATEGTVAVQDDATVDAAFTVESFSWFTLTYKGGNGIQVNLVTEDDSGLPGGRVDFTDLSGTYRPNDFGDKYITDQWVSIEKLAETWASKTEGYEFVGAYTNQNQGAEFKWIRYNTTGDWRGWRYSAQSGEPGNYTSGNSLTSIYLVYREISDPDQTAVTIADNVSASGKLTASYASESNVFYVWEKSADGTSNWQTIDQLKLNGDQYLYDDADQHALNVALEVVNDTQDDGGSWYRVSAYASQEAYERGEAALATSATTQLDYYDELQNGDFELPDVEELGTSNSNYQYPVGSEGLVWKTTGSDQQVEIVNEPNDLSDNASDYHNTDGAQNGKQYAELNCQAAGALYQDVLTVPGTDLNWQLYHRGRNGDDTMYLVIAPTDEVDDITTQDQLNDLIRKIEQNQGGYQESDGYYLLEITDNNKSWHRYASGSNDRPAYEVPSGQYMTRFFFVAGNTASKDPTVGNLLDNVQFTTGLLPAEEGEANLTITKVVSGVSEAAMEGYSVEVDVDGLKVTLDRFSPQQGGTYSATKTVTVGNIPGNGSKRVTVTENANTPGGYTAAGSTVSVNSEQAQTGTSAQVTLQERGSGNVTFTNTYKAPEPVDLNHSKYVKYNGDDTYDLSLDVLGSIRSEQGEKIKINLLYVLDNSTSMDYRIGSYGSPTRLQALKSAVNEMETTLQANDDLDVSRSAVVFSSAQYNNTYVYRDWGNTSISIDNLDTTNNANGTNYQAGIKAAEEQLAKIDASRSDAMTVVVFVSDGEPNRRGSSDKENSFFGNEAFTAACDEIADTQVDQLYAIGVGSDVAVSTLQELVNSSNIATEKAAYGTSDSGELTQIFKDLASQFTSVDAKNVTISDKLSDYAELTDNAMFALKVTNGEGQAVDVSPVSVTREAASAEGGATVSFRSGDKDVEVTIKYVDATKTFAADFPDDYVLDNSWTYTVTTQIQPTESAYNAGEDGYNARGDQGTDAPGNSTSSGQPGFHSNDSATLTYESAGQTVTDDYPNPVIQVHAKEVSGVLQVLKNLEGEELQTSQFKFQVSAVDPNSDKTSTVSSEFAGWDNATVRTFHNGEEAEDNIPLVHTGSDLTFDAGDIDQKYAYIYEEVEDDDNSNYIYDKTAWKVVVFVERNDDGEIVPYAQVYKDADGKDGNNGYEWTPCDSSLKPVEGEGADAEKIKLVKSSDGNPAITIQFSNIVSKSDLKIKKVVEGPEGMTIPDAKFTVRVELKDEDGNPITDEFSVEGIDNVTTAHFDESGAWEFEISADQIVTIKDLPVGATCKVTEPKDMIPGGFQLQWIGKADYSEEQLSTREAIKKEYEEEIQTYGNDVEVCNAFIGYGLSIFKGELAYDENGDIDLDENDLPYADQDKPLSGAEFEISAVIEGEKTVFGSLTTDQDGTAEFMTIPDEYGQSYPVSLMPGTYYINEVKVPSGYQLLGYEIALIIDESGAATISILQDESEPITKKLQFGEDGNYRIEVANKPNPDLPSSGSNGTLLMMSTGFAAIVLAGTYLSKRFGHLWN